MDEERASRGDRTIRMLQSMAGPDVSHVPGDILRVATRVADAWVAAGIAELLVEAPEAPEQATGDAGPERAARRRAR